MRDSREFRHFSIVEATYSSGRCLTLVKGYKKISLCFFLCKSFTILTAQHIRPHRTMTSTSLSIPSQWVSSPTLVNPNSRHFENSNIPKNISPPATVTSMCSYRLWQATALALFCVLRDITQHYHYLFTCLSTPLDWGCRNQRNLVNVVLSRPA